MINLDNIQLGRYFRTRDGTLALVEAKVDDKNWPYAGTLLCAGGAKGAVWKVDGSFWNAPGHDNDLVSLLPEDYAP